MRMKFNAMIRMMKSVQCHPENNPPSGYVFLCETIGSSTWVLAVWMTYACWAFLVLSSMIYLAVMS